MKVLAVETSTSNGSISIHENEDLLASFYWTKKKAHSELITELTQSLFIASDLSVNDINLFAVDIGPGSFTGVRVGVNLVRSLSYISKSPIAGVNSLQAIACGIPLAKKDLLVAQNAYGSQIYVQKFKPGKSKWISRGKPKLIPVKKVNNLIDLKTLVAGDSYNLWENQLSKSEKRLCTVLEGNQNIPTSINVFAAYRQNKSAKTLGWNELDPLYLKPSGAEEKRRLGLLKI